jgi:hypothetical protein
MQSYESLLNGDLNWALMEGSMHFEGTSAVHRTLKRLAHCLDELGIDYAIAGGMALFFHAYRRFTGVQQVLTAPRRTWEQFLSSLQELFLTNSTGTQGRTLVEVL